MQKFAYDRQVCLAVLVYALFIVCQPRNVHQLKIGMGYGNFPQQVNKLGVAFLRHSLVVNAKIKNINQRHISLCDKRAQVDGFQFTRPTIRHQNSAIWEHLFRQMNSVPVEILSFKFLWKRVVLRLGHSGVDEREIIQYSELFPVINNSDCYLVDSGVRNCDQIEPRPLSVDKSVGIDRCGISSATCCSGSTYGDAQPMPHEFRLAMHGDELQNSNSDQSSSKNCEPKIGGRFLFFLGSALFTCFSDSLRTNRNGRLRRTLFKIALAALCLSGVLLFLTPLTCGWWL